MKESQIKHENGNYWVCDEHDAYTVYKTGVTHSVSDSSYSHDADGYSIAVARCNYLANRNETPCTQCSTPLKPCFLKDGVCNGCRNPHLIVTAVTTK